MIHCFFLRISLLMISFGTCAQDTARLARNAIYLEAAGAGGYGSVNYERAMYSGKKIVLAIRTGAGTYHILDYRIKFNPDVLIPVSVNACYGQDHKLELGVGQTIAFIVHAMVTEADPRRMINFHTCFNLGYRYQKMMEGIVLRCTYTPMIEFNKYIRHWAGISIGYLF